MSILIKKYQVGVKGVQVPDTIIHEGFVTEIPKDRTRDREEIVTLPNGKKVKRVYYAKQANEVLPKPDILPDGKPLKEPSGKFDSIAYDKAIKEKIKSGVPVQDLIDSGLISVEVGKKYLPLEVKRDVYTEEPVVEEEKKLKETLNNDLLQGISWSGARQDVSSTHASMPKIVDKEGNTFNIKTYQIPAKWDSKTNTWDTSGNYNQSQKINLYTDKNNVTHYFNAAQTPVNKQGLYEATSLVPYTFGTDKNETANVMATGPLTIQGGTALDLKNEGIKHDPSKDKIFNLNSAGNQNNSGGRIFNKMNETIVPSGNYGDNLVKPPLPIMAGEKKYDKDGNLIITTLNKPSYKKGGLLKTKSKSCMCGSPLYKKKSGGTIHIDPKNKGKFTETKKATGKTTEELTHSKNSLTRKRAIFAQNSKRFNHSKK